jgi:Holliday junction DNA helicase RuvA
MIARLSGVLWEKAAGLAVVDCGGVGYEVHIPLTTFYDLPDQGEDISLYIKTVVREDAIDLFGFQTPVERQAFVLLNSVSKIGPRLALNILSGIGPAELATAVNQKNFARLGAVPGVGKKTAERVVLELKDKITTLALGDTPEVETAAARSDEPDQAGQDVVSALVNLGYGRSEAEKSLGQARADLGQDAEFAALLRSALKRLQKG